MALARVGSLAAVAVALTLTAACGSGGSGDPEAAASPGQPVSTPPASPTQQGSGPRVDESVTVRLADGQVSPPPQRVRIDEGDALRVVVRSDSPDTVHIHGYDIESRVRPGSPAVLRFTADQQGLFEVETHESGTQLFQLLVR